MRPWTLEERQHQAQIIQKWQPWKSAGVKTQAGKEISKMNAYKHGMRSAEMRKITQLISNQRKFLGKITNCFVLKTSI